MAREEKSVFHKKAAWFGCAALAATVLIAVAAPAGAEDVSFRGRNVRIIHTGSEGGSYAVYTRIFANHYGRHLPGAPNVIAEFMAGAGGLTGLNYIYNAAPKDGTALGMPLPAVSIANLLFPKNARFDPTRYTWIGNITQMQTAIGVWHTSPAKTLEDAKKVELTLGSSGRGSELTLTPMLLNAVVGTRFKVVSGYKGVGEIDLAMERGEVNGRSGGLTSWHPMKPEWFKRPAKVTFLVQLGLTRHPLLPDVPLATAFGKTDEDRKVIGLLSGSTALTRAVMGPPGMPAAVTAALRKGFDDTLADPAFIADMKTHKMDMIAPMHWKEIEAFMADLAATPPGVIKRFQQVLNVK